MIRELNSKSEASKLYVCSKDDGRVLACIKNCLGVEENNLVWCVKHNTEDTLEMVKLYRHFNVNDSVDANQFKRDQNKENIKDWRGMASLLIRRKKLTGTDFGTLFFISIRVNWVEAQYALDFHNLSLKLCLMVSLISKLISWSDTAFDMNTAIVSFECLNLNIQLSLT